MKSSQRFAAVPICSKNCAPTHSMNTRSANPQSALRWSKRRAAQRHLRLIARLARMGPTEFGQRVAKSLAKRLGFASDGSNTHSSLNFADTFPLGGARLQEYLSSQFDRSFYFGPANRVDFAAKIRSEILDAELNIRELADAVSLEGLSYLGQKVKIVAGEIDWQADPKSGKRCWTAGALDEAEAISCESADVKYVWEFNRLQFLPILGRAYWLSGEEHYAQQAVALIDDWISNNPVGFGVNWCSHLEVAMRSISWLWTMPLLLALPDLHEAFLVRWLGSIEAHYHHLRRNLSIYTDPTNHLIGEATALWMLCLCFPSLPDTEKEARRALLILTREVERQIAPDGVNCEQATSYHRFVLDFYLQILVLARRNEIELSPAVAEQIESMIEFVAALAGSVGIAPMIGDSDDARGLPFLELVGWNFKDTLSTGAVLFQHERWKRSAGHLAEVTVWLLGFDAINRYHASSCADDNNGRSFFPAGGYYFLRNGDPSGNAELIFDVGPLGLWPNAAHGHADALSILIRLNGKLLLTDPGTGAYFGHKHERDYFRGTAAHNTVTVDDLDQADLYDTFKWINPMKVTLLESHMLRGFSYVTASHDGYQRLRAGVTHKRSVLATGSDGWTIIDQIEGKGMHSIKRHFNFHPGTELQQLGSQTIIAWDPIADNGLRFDFPSAESSQSNRIDITQTGLWSGQYGDAQTAPHLVVEAVSTPGLTLFAFVTPIFSDRESQLRMDKCQLNIHTLDNQQTYVCHRCSSQPNYAHNDFVLINPSGQNATISPGYRCNARFAYLQQNEEGMVQRALLIGEGASLTGLNFQLSCARNERATSFDKVTQ